MNPTEQTAGLIEFKRVPSTQKGQRASFDVVINGETRGHFLPTAGREYTLFLPMGLGTAAWTETGDRAHRRTIRANSQDEFERAISFAIDNGAFPPLEECRERLRQKEEQKVRVKSIQEEDDRKERIREAGHDLLAACKAAHSAIVLGNGRQIDWDAIADQLRAAITRAEKPA